MNVTIVYSHDAVDFRSKIYAPNQPLKHCIVPNKCNLWAKLTIGIWLLWLAKYSSAEQFQTRVWFVYACLRVLTLAFFHQYLFFSFAALVSNWEAPACRASALSSSSDSFWSRSRTLSTLTRMISTTWGERCETMSCHKLRDKITVRVSERAGS